MLALLALLILTTLALTLAATTSREQQSAVNYRWSQKAFYNAEAGIEVGRYVLRRLAWIVPLPSARPPWPEGVRTWIEKPPPRHLPKTGTLVRDFEGSARDVFGNGMGFGPVLWDGETTYQDISSVDKHLLDGAFTLWVRRPIITVGDGTLFDYPFSDVLILVSEGVAPSDPPHLGVPRGRVVMEVTLLCLGRRHHHAADLVRTAGVPVPADDDALQGRDVRLPVGTACRGRGRRVEGEARFAATW